MGDVLANEQPLARLKEVHTGVARLVIPSRKNRDRSSSLTSRLEERAHAAAVRRSAHATHIAPSFGCSAARMQRITGVKTHLDTQQEEAPDLGTYGVYDSTLGIEKVNASTLWTQSTVPKEYTYYFKPSYSRHVAPTAYEYHNSKDYIDKGRNVAPYFSSFSSRTKRFEQAGVDHTEIPDAAFSLEAESKLWTSKGFAQTKASDRFNSASVPIVGKGHLSKPSDTPGAKYDTACGVLPTIASATYEESPQPTSSFRNKSERFPNPKFAYSRMLGPDTYSGAWQRAAKV
ncbi:hypothetical protein CYMTET_45577 [Cymbomonas tetramitiformis]|uniref:Uncharacterized protein n=1 Tax=Cymbomonas tetramitiformis TaxID=36881 RepID=A0AAE0BXZ4_9CHLO|nr:hypothetical protein CYMTET_45577 [Cymbomonas tetramitiformis]